MVKLPISDYVANYYKEQEIELTYRQQARLCWTEHSLLKDQLSSLKEILAISDDEKLNMEIRERVEYEEKAYECFMTNNNPMVIYVFHSDDEGEYYEEYFSSAEAAISYGISHSNKKFSVDKRYLLDKYPKELSEGMDNDGITPILATYDFAPSGDVIYNSSNECKAPFDEEDSNRFEYMFLNIKSPFGRGDIVMGPD